MKIFTSFRTDLYLTFIFSLAIILSIELWLINIPELFNGGELIGKIVLKLCYAILAAIVFYFLGVHLNNYRKRKQILPLLNTHLKKLIWTKNVWLSELYFIAVNKSNGEIDWPKNSGGLITNYFPTTEEVTYLANFTPYSETRSDEQNWIDRIFRMKNDFEQLCSSILILDNNLMAQEISLIGELRSCDLFSKTAFHKFRQEKGAVVLNKDINFIEPELQSFILLIEKIEKQIVNRI